MDAIVLSGMPGQDVQATWTAYRQATQDLHDRVSDQEYEDIMNGVARLVNGEVVYYGDDELI